MSWESTELLCITLFWEYIGWLVWLIVTIRDSHLRILIRIKSSSCLILLLNPTTSMFILLFVYPIWTIFYWRYHYFNWFKFCFQTSNPLFVSSFCREKVANFHYWFYFVLYSVLEDIFCTSNLFCKLFWRLFTFDVWTNTLKISGICNFSHCCS